MLTRRVILTVFLLSLSVCVVAQTHTRKDVSDHQALLSALQSAASLDEARVLINLHRQQISGGLNDELLKHAAALSGRNDYAAAGLAYDIAELVAIQLSDKGRLAEAVHQKGRLYFAQGDLRSALKNYLNSKSVLEEARLTEHLVSVLKDIGVVRREMGELAAARDDFGESLRLASTRQDKKCVAYAQLMIATLDIMEGNYAQAVPHLTESLTLFRELNSVNQMADSLAGLGEVHKWMGDNRRASAYYTEAVELARAGGERRRVKRILNGTALLYASQGDYEKARTTIQQTLQISREINDQIGLAYGLRNLGGICQEQGDTNCAIDSFTQALALAERIGLKEVALGSWLGLGITYEAMGQLTQAEEHLNRSLMMAGDLATKPVVAGLLMALGKLYLSKGDYTRAIETSDRAARLATNAGELETSYTALTVKGKALLAKKQYDGATQVLTEAAQQIEKARSQVAGGERERQRFFEGRLNPYHALVELQVGRDHRLDALTSAERAKGRVLLDVLASGRINVTKEMTDSERVEEQRLNAEIISLNREVTRINNAQIPDRERLESLEQQLQKARLAYETFRTGLYASHPKLKIQRGVIPTITLARLYPFLIFEQRTKGSVS